MTSVLPLPNVSHGQRIILSIIDQRAKTEPESPWVSAPVDEADLTKGYKEISYGQFANAVNHAVHWLKRHLPSSSEPFQRFAYSGPKDLRYPILAVAAGKLGKVIVLPSSIITLEAQLHILSKTACSIYVGTTSIAATVDELARRNTSLRTITAPELDELMQNAPAEPVVYAKSWEEGADDPWVFFHTSGTTGNPKPVCYTHRMMAIPDFAASLEDIAETHIHHYTEKRWYTPLPMLHFVGMLMTLTMTSCLRSVVVLGPIAAPPAPAVVKSVLKHGRVDGALLVPALIDALCVEPDGLSALRALDYIHYVGAPLGVESGVKLTPHVRVVPSIGSTEAGGYFTKIRDTADDWDYVEFQPHAGAHFESRMENLHELVFVREPNAPMQQIFLTYPDKDRHATNDLWIEHPAQKDLWKIVGRADDYVYLAHGEGLHASTLEPELERHELVQTALIGGHARSKPVALVELVTSAHNKAETDRNELLRDLQPYMDKVNAHCHPSVQLSPDAVIFVTQEKPLLRTIKGSVARAQSLKLYEAEIEKLFR